MNDNVDPKRPDAITFGIMAGKGGVGKTLISCNLARVISWSAPVLLVDLDLYNRGSSALLVTGGVQPGTMTVYGLLEATMTGVAKEASALEASALNWDAFDEAIRDLEPVKVDERYYVLPSSITGDPIESLEYRLSATATRDFLGRVASALSEKYGLDCIVFDCKAGPDPLSLGVVGIAEETVLISEYNPITYDGMLNFHHYMLKAYGSPELRRTRIGVVVNKIPEKFDLTRSDLVLDLQRRLRPLSLLAAFPFEYDVFQSFGDFKFVVDQLPKTRFTANISALARVLLEPWSREPNERIVQLSAGASTSASKHGYRGVRSVRDRVFQLIAFLGLLAALAGLSVVIGEHIAQGKITSVMKDRIPIAATGLTLAGLGALLVGFFLRR